MAEVIFRLPGNAQFSYVEVKFDSDEINTNAPEDTQALLKGALADLNAAFPDISAPVNTPVSAPQAAPQSGKTCQHGAMLPKSGGPNAKGKMWSGHFCPNKDRNNACPPVWDN